MVHSVEPVDEIDLSEFTEKPEFEEYPGEKSLFQKNKKKIIIGVSIAVIFSLIGISLIVIIVPSIVVPIVNGDDSETPAPIPNNVDENGNYYSVIKNTTEYQIKITDFNSWKNRDEELQIWINVMNENSTFLNITTDDVNTVARVQYTVNIEGEHNCYQNWEIRVRDYLTGPKTGHSEVDIKGNNIDVTKAYELPFTPAEVYSTNSSQKCEKDVHYCPNDDKWSHETRIAFDYNIDFETCRDLVALYPDAFPKLPKNKYANQVYKAGDQYWWLASIIGTLDGDTNYEISFTLRYSSRDAALNGGKPTSGSEWSIRLYSLNAGHTNDYNHAVQSDIENMYHALLDVFGGEVCL